VSALVVGGDRAMRRDEDFITQKLTSAKIFDRIIIKRR